MQKRSDILPSEAQLFREASRIVPKPGTENAEIEMINAIKVINLIQKQDRDLARR